MYIYVYLSLITDRDAAGRRAQNVNRLRDTGGVP